MTFFNRLVDPPSVLSTSIISNKDSFVLSEVTIFTTVYIRIIISMALILMFYLTFVLGLYFMRFMYVNSVIVVKGMFQSQIRLYGRISFRNMIMNLH